jgi:hypothetical protein
VVTAAVVSLAASAAVVVAAGTARVTSSRPCWVCGCFAALTVAAVDRTLAVRVGPESAQRRVRREGATILS